MNKVSPSVFKVIKSCRYLANKLAKIPSAIHETYNISENYRRDYQNSDNRIDVIQKIVDSMGFYLGNLHKINVRIIKDDQSIFDFKVNTKGVAEKPTNYSFAGQWNGSNVQCITIANEQQYRFDNCMAILAHEYTHCFLEQHNIICEFLNNEIFTDIAAAYLGFGFLLLRGYQSYGFSIGYINNSSISFTIGAAVVSRKWKFFPTLMKCKSVKEFVLFLFAYIVFTGSIKS